MRVAFLGPPGAGKGTQAATLARSANVPHISTGDILRHATQLATPTGVLAKSYMERGELVPFEIVLRLVRDRLQEPDARAGWILDGFPRNLPQAKAFADLLQELKVELSAVVYFEIPDAALIRRLAGRRICRSCQATYHLEFSPPKDPAKCDRCGGELYQRSDDSEKSVANRLKVYKTETNPLVAHYNAQGLLVTVNADRAIGQISEDLDAKFRH